MHQRGNILMKSTLSSEIKQQQIKVKVIETAATEIIVFILNLSIFQYLLFYSSYSNQSISSVVGIGSIFKFIIQLICDLIKLITKKMDMESPPKSTEKFQKMNNSSAAFRELIESLRHKNKNIGKQVYSEVNPQSEASYSVKNYGSESNWRKNQLTKIQKPNNIPLLINQDQMIKLKPKGNIAGRDILQKKPSALPSSKFNNTVANFRTQLRNKNIEEQTKPVIQIKQPQTQITYPKINQSMINIPKPTQQQFFMPPPVMQKAKSFNQNRLNQKVVFKKKIKDVDQQLIVKYWENSNNLSEHSQAPQIFDFFEGLILAINVSVPNPFIKKYKNCIYFGHQLHQHQKYEGFLYFYDKKFYFGQFMNGQKNGQGTQIYFDQNLIYKGIFKEGQKSGKFFVTKPHQQYIGILQKGIYHGEGKLITKESVYQGSFHKGEKHGFGEELFPGTGLKFTGYFNKGHFEKRSKSSFASTASDMGKGISFKSHQNHNEGSFTDRDHHNHHTQNRNPYLHNKPSYKNRSFDNKKKRNEQFFDDGLGIANQNPFSSYKPYNKKSQKSFYNKDKIVSYAPQMRNPQVDEMPQNCQQFDYSFDVSSRRDSEMSQLGNWNIKKHNRQGNTYALQFPQIDEERMDTTQYQEPLPVPCFYPRH